MFPLRIYLFGKFKIECHEQVLAGLEARRAQELLSYLLLYRDRAHSREVLADLLGNHEHGVDVRKSFRQALWRLQTALDSRPELRDCCLLWVEPDWIQLNPKVAFWLDVAEFEAAFGAVHNIQVEKLEPHHIQTLNSALTLYRGDLLTGCYQDWCLLERERLQDMYLTMLDRLMAYYECNQDYQTGIAYGIRILGYDRARESTHRQLMRLYYGAGYRIKALRQYEQCAAILEQELGVEPGQRTQALYQRIIANHLDRLPMDTATLESAAVSGLQDQLTQLRADLATMEHRIQAVERALKGE